MEKLTTAQIVEWLKNFEGQELELRDIMRGLNIAQDQEGTFRVLLSRLAKQKTVIKTGSHRGVYKVIKRVQPVRVFIPGRERRAQFNLSFPRDSKTEMEISIGEQIVMREGDLITLGGVKSKGKTLLCLNFVAENIDKCPVLMGNEYTTFTEDHYDPTPRFLARLDEMNDWVEWTDKEGYDKFVLLPVRADYAEHIVRDKINVIDWVNLDGDRLYNISKVLEEIKAALGRGIAIIALQKGEGATNPRGGQFVRDFSDVEILLDGFGDNEDDILMTLKGVKEKKAPIVGKTYAYTVAESGTRLWNFREVKRCGECKGTGYTKGGRCEECFGRKFIDA